ncbi:hypothetical protein Mal48_09700 [Thalassoglobus polymorphus]|uniref:Uncharacterized protein n=1 Tax=Thalassoglobus polymorphus TaxID=2527994 RepID=A0A517QJF9_9PLAN|nr:hypothetical protein Mal48_09700 [Thalassoglobus polymorphus]
MLIATSQILQTNSKDALAIKFDGLINDGIVSDQSELAPLAHVARLRITQVINLLHLSSDIQEKYVGVGCKARCCFGLVMRCDHGQNGNS